MDRAPWLYPDASKLLSIWWDLAELHWIPQSYRVNDVPAGIMPPLWEAALPNFRLQIHVSIFQPAVSKEKELTSSLCSYAVHLACDTATDCLIVCLIQSLRPLSPILKFVIATYISRKYLHPLWIPQDLLHNCLCKYLSSLQRNTLLPKLLAPSLCSLLCCPVQSPTASAAPALPRDTSLVPGPVCAW